MGDNFDHALAETAKGYYKAELIYGPAHTRPWKCVEHVELATLAWVHLHNATSHGRIVGTYADRFRFAVPASLALSSSKLLLECC